MATAKKKARPRVAAQPKDAVAMLKADHKKVSGLFEKSRAASTKKKLLKDVIAQVKGVEPNGEMYDARVKVMGEFVKHHVKEGQNEMFPKAKKTKLDTMTLGAQMAARKAELIAAGPA